ncbi:MAG TPA: GNAT family N-acetyltransferase [Vicinamibacterales bacterium]|nr:GNAT family N-acetyltransferase [Vicinamibacterales bacterium]
MGAAVHVVDPLADPRWDGLLARHPRASVFHTRGWLDALKRTYGYEPFALTTTSEGALENGLALCRVKTPFARRLVSLPFSDHCDPLVDRPEDVSAMLGFLKAQQERERWRSVELRPRQAAWGLAAEAPAAGGDGARPSWPAESARYVHHALDLARPAEQVFAGFHPSHTQRAVRRAEREGLTYEAGNSEPLVSAFYGLLRLTRRRHGLPPQPRAWFRNLATSLGDQLAVHLASKDGQPIAAILTLGFKRTIVYKYGASDAAFHRLGAMPFLFWRAIQDARSKGIIEMDLGRSDLGQPGLAAFKDHLGAERAALAYCAWPVRRARPPQPGALSRLARSVVPLLPDAVLDWSGRMLYRHLG